MSPTASETGWGVNAADRDQARLATVRLGVVYGQGIATYMNDGGMDLAPSRVDSIRAVRHHHPRSARPRP